MLKCLFKKKKNEIKIKIKKTGLCIIITGFEPHVPHMCNECSNHMATLAFVPLWKPFYLNIFPLPLQPKNKLY